MWQCDSSKLRKREVGTFVRQPSVFAPVSMLAACLFLDIRLRLSTHLSHPQEEPPKMRSSFTHELKDHGIWVLPCPSGYV